MGTKELSTRLVNYDILRVVAAYLIVMLHLSVQYINKAPVSVDEYLQWQQAIKLSTFSRLGVPIFVMLSGAFLLAPKKKLSLGNVFKKYVPKLILIFVFWSFFYSLFHQGFFENLFIDGFASSWDKLDWDKFWPYFALGHYHMWYLYMLIGLYLLTPLIKHITDHATAPQIAYFVFLCFVVTSVTKLNEDLWHLQLLDNLLDKMSLSFFFGYLGYFIAGHFLSAHTPRRFFSVIICVLGFFAFRFTYQETWLLNPMFGFEKPNLVYFSNYSPTVFLMSFALFLIFAKLGDLNKLAVFSKLQESKLWAFLKTVLSRLPQYMLVVYLVHPFMIVQCRSQGLLQPTTSAWSLPTNAFIVYLVSLAISIILMEAYKLVFRRAK